MRDYNTTKAVSNGWYNRNSSILGEKRKQWKKLGCHQVIPLKNTNYKIISYFLQDA